MEGRDCERQKGDKKKPGSDGRGGVWRGPKKSKQPEIAWSWDEPAEDMYIMYAYRGLDKDNGPRDGTLGLGRMMRPTVGLSSTGTS